MARSLLLACTLMMACQEDEPLPPPPVQGSPSGGPAVPPGGGGEVPGSDDSMEPEPLDSDGLDDSSGGSSDFLLAGQLLDGTTGLLPNACSIRLHTLDSIDPGSGIPLEVAFEELVPVQQLPLSYVIADVPPDMIVTGDQIYVSTLCDVDGDGMLDNFGAYYPAIPLEPVALPAEGIDLTLDFVR